MQKEKHLVTLSVVRASGSTCGTTARDYIVYALSLAKPETRRMMLKLYRGVNPQDFIEREDRLHTLTAHVPTLVLWGDKEPFIAPEYAEQFGSAQVEHFPQNSHWLAAEAPDIVAQRLATFFAQTGHASNSG